MNKRHMTCNPWRRLAATMALCLMLMPVVTARAQDVADSDITSAINTQLMIDNAVSANAINVSTVNGIVTLTGRVNNILAKERAQALTEAIVGVRAILNRIDVAPTVMPSDAELALAVNDAWLADPATYAYKLDAEANDGAVTLTGTVDSFAERDLAETVAKSVRGVQAVDNQITVDYAVTRADAVIKDEIEARLKNNVRIADYRIDVDVDNGAVTLSGAVGSLQEKTQARTDAWVAGVTSVDSDDLEIQWWARDDMKRTDAYVARTNEELKDAVEDALLYDPRVSAFQPDIEVSHGTVTLSGEVDNLLAKRAAEQVAKNTMGVRRVKNHLKVRPDIPSNEELETHVSTALINDPYVDRYAITVNAYSGWVYLSGDVDNGFKKNRAERVAEGVQGVIGVVNNLDFDYGWSWKPDWEIREDVRDQLTWNVFVDASDINVSVDDGVVTLHGTVDSWTERDEAEKNAFQGGAKDVTNNLVVEYRHYGPYGPGYYGSPYYRGPGYYGPTYEPYD